MTEDETVDALKAAAHPVRLRILRALAGAERSVGDIDAVAVIGQPALSQQLAVLRAAGLVLTRREAKQVFYHIDETKVGVLAGVIGSMVGRQAPPARAKPHPASSAARFARLG